MKIEKATNPITGDSIEEMDLITLHSEFPEIAITRDRTQVWVDDRLVWDSGEFEVFK